jgi:hypothetical protein
MVNPTAWIGSDARILVILASFRSAADGGGLPEIDAFVGLRVGTLDAKPDDPEVSVLVNPVTPRQVKRQGSGRAWQATEGASSDNINSTS